MCHLKKDGLENLENLKSLNLAGNHLDSVQEFYKIKNLENLTQLYLTDEKLSATNPICNKNYRMDIFKILPKLEIIDGKLALETII
jgi:Leucine-rich repeat (LRR) protein